jgi:hypothetical protein
MSTDPTLLQQFGNLRHINDKKVATAWYPNYFLDVCWAGDMIYRVV